VWGPAILAGAVAFGVKLLVAGQHRWIVAVLVLGAFGIVYLGVTAALGLREARALTGRLTARLRR
jgi:hypothetical protein